MIKRNYFILIIFFVLAFTSHAQQIPVIIKGKEIILPEQAEEYATMFAKFIYTPYI